MKKKYNSATIVINGKKVKITKEPLAKCYDVDNDNVFAVILGDSVFRWFGNVSIIDLEDNDEVKKLIDRL